MMFFIHTNTHKCIYIIYVYHIHPTHYPSLFWLPSSYQLLFYFSVLLFLLLLLLLPSPPPPFWWLTEYNWGCLQGDGWGTVYRICAWWYHWRKWPSLPPSVMINCLILKKAWSFVITAFPSWQDMDGPILEKVILAAMSSRVQCPCLEDGVLRHCSHLPVFAFFYSPYPLPWCHLCLGLRGDIHALFMDEHLTVPYSQHFDQLLSLDIYYQPPRKATFQTEVDTWY